MKKLPIPFKIPAILLLPAALALLGALAYKGYFLYEVMASSVGRGAGKYALELPAVKAVNTKDAPQCAQKTAKWLGCM